MSIFQHDNRPTRSVQVQGTGTGIVSVVVGAVGWVVNHLYHSGNPQVRAYYDQDPFASPSAAQTPPRHAIADHD